MTDRACKCWDQVILTGHEGHCCLREMSADHDPLMPLECGHHDDAMRRNALLEAGRNP